MASHRLRLKKGATSDKLLNQAANWLFEIQRQYSFITQPQSAAIFQKNFIHK